MENVKDEVDFLPANKHQSFLETDIINLGVWPSMPKLPKVAILQRKDSLPYLKKEVSDEVDFLHADKDESFLQIDTKIFDGDDSQTFLNFPK